MHNSRVDKTIPAGYTPGGPPIVTKRQGVSEKSYVRYRCHFCTCVRLYVCVCVRARARVFSQMQPRYVGHHWHIVSREIFRPCTDNGTEKDGGTRISSVALQFALSCPRFISPFLSVLQSLFLPLSLFHSLSLFLSPPALSPIVRDGEISFPSDLPIFSLRRKISRATSHTGK